MLPVRPRFVFSLGAVARRDGEVPVEAVSSPLRPLSIACGSSSMWSCLVLWGASRSFLPRWPGEAVVSASPPLLGPVPPGSVGPVPLRGRRPGPPGVVGCERGRSGVSVGRCGSPEMSVSGVRGPAGCPALVPKVSRVVGAPPGVLRLPGGRAGPGSCLPGRCVGRPPSDAVAASVRVVCRRRRYPRAAGTQIKIR